MEECQGGESIMCGRYYVDDETAREIEKLVHDVDKKLRLNHQSKDLYPAQTATVLHKEKDNISASDMIWGFPRFGTTGLLINARAETLLERPTFKESALYRRCIIPARSFYEWNPQKEKVTFSRGDNSILYMAGVYNMFKDDVRFVIITTEANESVRSTHSRMPVILEQNELENWVFDTQAASFILNKTPVPLVSEYEYHQQSIFDTP